MSALEDATVDLWGKDCDDLQSGVTISGGICSGNLKHISDYTFKYVVDYTSAGFDMSQGTNFIALEAKVSTGTTVKCKFNSKTTTLDEDGIIVLQMTEAKKALSAVFEATNEVGDKNSVEVKLSGLTLAEE